MTLADHAAAVRLWRKTEGMSLTEDDGRAGIALYLRRNRGLCFVAVEGSRLVATVLCGHDGRRGILRHLAVAKSHRGRGLARQLIARSLAALARQSIARCNVFVMDDHPAGRRFWDHLGFYRLADDYRTLQLKTSTSLAP